MFQFYSHYTLYTYICINFNSNKFHISNVFLIYLQSFFSLLIKMVRIELCNSFQVNVYKHIIHQNLSSILQLNRHIYGETY